MVVKVGINGFGRIGRIVSRACLQNSGLQLSAINDPAISADYISYLLKFDSTHGKLNGVITQSNDEIVIDGLHIKVFHERYPTGIPWQSAGVQYVVEASGMYTNYEKASGHLVSVGVKRVIVTAPSVDIPMVVLGVNDNNVPQDSRVISGASSTLYCLAPIVKVLEDTFGVEEGFITSIHAMTPSLKPLDGLCLRGRHWRDHRGIHQNIIPAPTGACKALGKILPSAKDKLTGIAFRVPIVNVSVLDLTVRLQVNTSIQEIVNNVQLASKCTFRNIIKVSNDEAVSSDFVGETHSCIFDESSSIQLKPNFFKIICWYENEYSYACRIVDSIVFSENQFTLAIPMSILKSKPVTTSKMLQTDMIPLKCSCRNSLAISDILGLSQDTGDGKKTPISCANKKSATVSAVGISKDKQQTKKEEMLKIWNNRSEMTQSCVKPVKCNFFKPCVGFPPVLKKVECNNQQRLESVRKEFTKMVSITEDLLRKTQSNQGVRSTSKDEISGMSRVDLVTKEKNAKSFTIMNNQITSVEELVDSKCSGDAIQAQNDKSRDDTVPVAPNHNEKSESDGHNNIVKLSKNFIDISEVIKKLNRNDEDKDKKTLTQLEKEGNNEAIVKLNKGESKPITKTTIAANDVLTQNKEFKFVWNSHHRNSNKDTKNEQIKLAPKQIFTELSESNFPKMCTFVNRKDKITLNKLELLSKKSNLNVINNKIDEALRKRNIVLVKDTADSESELCIAEADDSPAESDDKIDVPVTKRVAEDSSVNISTKEITKHKTIDYAATLANNAVSERQDIFDKLDSISGSDSNNSFEIQEKKSQVIQLADLTNSLEDLTRLNNICRIIEISDELSDKLFSALDGAGTSMKKKRWSFKDLCARIKLDEFCNKVFGGT